MSSASGKAYRQIRWNWLLKEWNGRCAYCGGVPTTEDHIIPRSKGGKDAWWNVIPACQPCNQAKRDMSLREFLEDKKKIYKRIIAWRQSLPKAAPFSNIITYDEVVEARMQKYDRFRRYR
jgi:5-methylcytosine-specific restriction endonuclease McrA